MIAGSWTEWTMRVREEVLAGVMLPPVLRRTEDVFPWRMRILLLARPGLPGPREVPRPDAFLPRLICCAEFSVLTRHGLPGCVRSGALGD